MKPPPRAMNGQSFAHRLRQGQKGFADQAATRDTVLAGRGAAIAGADCLNCYPSPSFWPDPVWIRPFFRAISVARAAQFCADPGRSHQIGFPQGGFVAIIDPIITKARGNKRCRSNPLPLQHWQHFRLRAVCKTRQPADLAGPLLARLPLMRWTKTCLQAQPLGPLVVLRHVMFRARLTASKGTDTTAPLGRLTPQATRAQARVAFSYFPGGERHV
jgi:hypothetical protein